jgi:Ca-activated chloride channel family protein
MNSALISTFELGIAKSSKALFSESKAQNHNKDVLLITDGDIWDVEAVIASAKSSGHRVFAIGVGSAPAESLLREMAEKSGGACELVSPNQDVAEVIVRMFRRMRSTRCTEVKVDWGQDIVWQSNLPSTLYGGDTLHLCARLAKIPESAPILTWVAQDTAMQASAQQLQSQSPALLPRLVAFQQIAQLISGKESQEQTLALALKYQLVTDQTNLILVHVREDDKKAEGLPELDKVNHMLAAGWGGVGSVDALSGGVAYSRRHLGNSGGVRFSIGASIPSMSTPSVWRNRTSASACVASSVSDAMDDFEIPGFLLKQAEDSVPGPIASTFSKIGQFVSPSAPRATPRVIDPGPVVVPLELLQAFEAASSKVLAANRFVSALQALHLPTELTKLLDDFTVVLGSGAKAWAVVIEWLAEAMTEQFTLSRQAQRLLRHTLKDEDAAILADLREKLTNELSAVQDAQWGQLTVQS